MIKRQRQNDYHNGKCNICTDFELKNLIKLNNNGHNQGCVDSGGQEGEFLKAPEQRGSQEEPIRSS